MIDGSVCLAYVHNNQVAHCWYQSMISLLAHDSGGARRLSEAGIAASRCGTDGLVEARNLTVASFLEGPAEWLMWTDTDMGFAPDSLDRLLAAADPAERPIVGGLCFAWQEYEPDGMGGWHAQPMPTLYQWTTSDGGQKVLASWLDYPRGEVVQVAATGSAMILIHRDVFTKVGEAHGVNNWYSRIRNPGTQRLLGEDLSFCVKAGACGFPVHVHTGVKTTHQKTLWVSEELFMEATS